VTLSRNWPERNPAVQRTPATTLWCAIVRGRQQKSRSGKAYREGALPFPDGTIIAALHWHYLSSQENNKAFGRAQSFIAGSPTNIQFMVKDSKKYSATGGWAFADFTDGKPGDEAMHQTCFPATSPSKLATLSSPVTHPKYRMLIRRQRAGRRRGGPIRGEDRYTITFVACFAHASSC
jgi:hypothetical protein